MVVVVGEAFSHEWMLCPSDSQIQLMFVLQFLLKWPEVLKIPV